MYIEAVICLTYQLFVEPMFTDSRFIASDQKYGFTFGVECKCDPPDSAR